MMHAQVAEAEAAALRRLGVADGDFVPFDISKNKVLTLMGEPGMTPSNYL